MKRSSVVTAAALFLGLAVVGGGLALYQYRKINAPAQPHMEFPEAVQVVVAREAPWQPTSDLIGTVLSLRSVHLSNELAGRIDKVLFENGAVVEAGQVLVKLDDSTDRADLAAAQASVRVAEASKEVANARLQLAQTELRAMRQAGEANAAAEIELDRSNAEFKAAQAELTRAGAEADQARARVAQVEARLAKMEMKAPFRARAGLRMVHDGQYIQDGTMITQLEEITEEIYLDFAIPQEYLPRVRTGMTVKATGELLGPAPVDIKVVAVDSSVSNETRNIRVRGVVDNKDQRLRPGMFIQVRVPVDEAKPFVMIPSTAVRRSSFSDQVFVVTEEKPNELRAKQRFVKLGPAVGEDVIVLEGVKAGEKIASSGSFKLRDGGLVMPKDPKSEGASGETAAAPKQHP